MKADPENRIVVGLDGSSGSRDALLRAIRQARFTGAAVEAILAWEWAPRYAVYPCGPSEGQLQHDAEQLLKTELDSLTGADRSLVAGRFERGHPAAVLTKVAGNAALLVVGSRGAGSGFRHLAGSVTLKCVRHAEVSVVVTHSPNAGDSVVSSCSGLAGSSTVLPGVWTWPRADLLAWALGPEPPSPHHARPGLPRAATPERHRVESADLASPSDRWSPRMGRCPVDARANGPTVVRRSALSWTVSTAPLSGCSAPREKDLT